MEQAENEHGLIVRLLTSVYPESDGATAHGRGGSASKRVDIAAQIESFIDEMPGGFFIYRADNDKILYVNKALLRIYLCDTVAEFRELVGNSFRGMVHPEDIDKIEKSINEQIAQSHDDLDYVEYRIIRKDGSIRWVEDFGHFVHIDKFGDIFYVFITDATEKLNRRFKLISGYHEKEQQLQNLIEEYDKERKLIRQEHLQRLEVIEGLSVNYESILYADVESDLVLPYRMSMRLERQFEKKFQPKPFRWFLKDYVAVWVHPEDKALFAERTSPEYMLKRLTETPTYYINFRCIQNGEVKYIQLRIAAACNDGSIGRLVLGFRSMDEEIMQQLKHRELLEDALKTARLAEVAKNSFLSNMSHDMNTPLNALFGFTELARKNANNPDAVRGYLDRIEETGKQMLDLVSKVLDLSYTESQELALDLTECKLSDIIGDVADSVKSNAEHKRIAVKLENRTVHDGVCADKDRLKQLLGHLVGNAVTYTKPDGEVCFSVVEQATPSDEIATFIFTVLDNGIGIAPDALERIFEPFEREQNTTFSGVYGAGLGLTIAKRISDKMGGHITVESEVGKGSRFTFTVSLRLSAEQTADGGVEAVDLGDKKILLVEDNEINLEIETEIIEGLGFNVDTAENGQIAVDKISAAKPDEYAFVLMDIQMPVLDGHAAAKAIRRLENAELANIPIIALSANALESDKRASMESGMNGHLAKPLDVTLMLKTVAKIMNGKKKP